MRPRDYLAKKLDCPAPCHTFPLIATLLSWLILGACGILGGKDVGQRTAEGGSASRTITVDELDQITKSFADRYVLLLANACDEIRRDAPSPEQRRNAHRLKLSGATAAYDVATGPDPVKQLVDLAVIVALQKIVWVDEGQAVRFFGADLGARLSRALVTAEGEIWELCARAMRPEQIQVLEETIRAWRRDNPGLEWISSIRFDVVAGGEGAPLVEGILGTLSAASGAITDSVGQARLFGQRTFYYLKRLPILLSWQSEAALENAFAVPEAAQIVQGLSSVLESSAVVFERLDQLAAPSHEGDAGEIDPKLREIHQLLSEGKDVGLAARAAVAAFADLLDGRPILEEASASLEAEEQRRSRPFDINEYTAAGAQFAQAIGEATTLIHEARSLVESELATRRVEEVVDAAARGIAQQKRETIDLAAWRVAQLVILTIVLFTLSSGILLWLRRRGRTTTRRLGP